MILIGQTLNCMNPQIQIASEWRRRIVEKENRFRNNVDAAVGKYVDFGT
jgi:hypothetical protein